jgi:AhpD family alkylhydroperoxidase
MSRENKIPAWYASLSARHGKFMEAVEELGRVVKQEGPLDEKTAHLVQLAAAAALRSEGSVHSHARRALKAGATREELDHAVILLTSTIGFPTVSAALSWVEDVVDQG